MAKRLEGFGWLIRSSAVILSGSVLGNLIGLAAIALLARSLGLEVFGQFSLILAFLATVAAFGNNALSRTIARFSSFYWAGKNFSALTGTVIGITAIAVLGACLLSVPMYLMADWIAEKYLHAPSLAGLLRIVTLTVAPIVGTSCLIQALRGLGFVTDRMLLESILRPALKFFSYTAILALLGGMTLRSAVWIEVSIVFFIFILAGGLTWLRYRPYLGHGLTFAWKEIGSFTVPLIPATLSVQLALQLPLLFLGFAGMTTQAGLLFAGMRVAAVGEMILASLNSNFAPMISAYQGSSRLDELRDLFRQVTRVESILLSLWVCGAIVFGEYVLEILGNEYTAAYPLFVLLSMRIMVVGLTGPVGHVLIMTGYTRRAMIASFVFLTICAVLLFVLTPVYGATGAAISVVCAKAVNQFLHAWWAWKKLKINGYDIRNYLSGAVMVIGAFLIWWVVKFIISADSIWVSVACSAALFVVVILPVNWMFSSAGERQRLRNLLTQKNGLKGAVGA